MQIKPECPAKSPLVYVPIYNFLSGAGGMPSHSRKEDMMNREMNQLPDVRRKC